MRKGILSLSLPGLRRPTPARRTIPTTSAAAQPFVSEPMAANPTPWPVEPIAEALPPLIPEPEPAPVQETAPLRPRTPSMMKAVLKRHEEIATRVHKRQEESTQQ